MSKLHAQMALLGTIDEVVCLAENPQTVRMVESFLPGTTGIGQRGWYREVKRFLNREDLQPRDADGGLIPRDGPVTFPDYADAISELAAPEVAGERAASPATQSRTMFAATVLSKALAMENGQLGNSRTFSAQVPDPLDALLPAIARNITGPLPGVERSAPEDPVAQFKSTLRGAETRRDYFGATGQLARSSVIDPDTRDVLARPPVCTGSLRRIGRQFCVVLTTDWNTPFTMSQMAQLIDPHNWPQLCDFFVSVTDQAPRTPDLSRGWTRILESVSGDETQWQLRTALRYWKGVAPATDGIYINYDLDNPRVGDCKLIEVDAGYIWATPHSRDDPNSTVRLRTCKQVRIRGVSATATAALACGFGWGDAMSQMFNRPTPPGSTAFSPSVDPGKPADTGPSGADGPPETPTGIADAAEDVELVEGWRGAIIEGMRAQLNAGITAAAALGTDFAVKWSEGGFSREDATALGMACGSQMSSYAAGMFEAAAAALQPKADDLAGGGN